MPVQVTSSTDNAETVASALGEKAQSEPAVEAKPAEEAKPASEEIKPSDETADESETSETEEIETNEAGDGDEPDAGEEQPADGAKPKKKGGFQKRIDKLSKRVSDMEREKEYWREQALRTQSSAGSDTPKEKPKESTPAEAKKPVAGDFESIEAFTEALADYKLDQRFRAEEAKHREHEAKSFQQTRLQKHQERLTAAATNHDDWEDVMDDFKRVPVPMAVEEAVLSSENSGELTYYLAKNPDELKKLSSMDLVSAARTIGRIEASFSKTSSEVTKSKAPSPVTPIRTKGSTQSKSIYDPDLSPREYEKLRMEQMKKRKA